MPLKGYKPTKDHRRKISEANSGEKHSMFGRKRSEVAKRKQAEAMKGDRNPAKRPEVRKKISKAKTGSKLSKETKQKISKAMKGKSSWRKGKTRIYSEETLRRMSEALKGRIFTQETRKKISESLRGEKNPMWGKRGRDNPMYGKKHTEEARKKISKNHADISGIKNPNWEDGKSFEPYSIDWTETLRRVIRERDHYICLLCGQSGNEVHHIDYDKKNCNPKNLITLCHNCHLKTYRNRKYWIQHFNNT